MTPGASTKRKHTDENQDVDSRKKSKASEPSSPVPLILPGSSSNERDLEDEEGELKSPVAVKTERIAPILNDRDMNSG
jgi:hypothetical protein